MAQGLDSTSGELYVQNEDDGEESVRIGGASTTKHITTEPSINAGMHQSMHRVFSPQAHITRQELHPELISFRGSMPRPVKTQRGPRMKKNNNAMNANSAHS